MEPNLDDLMNSLADFREVIATTEQGLKELKSGKSGGSGVIGRVGPKKFPKITFPEAIKVKSVDS